METPEARLVKAVLAEYGSALRESSNEALAESQLQSIWQNVRLLAPC